MTSFRVEMKDGEIRTITADAFTQDELLGWLIFNRRHPAQVVQEYWRVRLDCVVSMETVRPDCG